MHDKEEESDSTAYLPLSVFGPKPPKAGSTVTATVVSVEGDEVEVSFAAQAPEEEADTEGDLVEGVDKIPSSEGNNYAGM
jgi:hypothetical protein